MYAVNIDAAKKTDVPAPPNDRPYHHGNLRAALVHAAVALAEEGGPDAVVLREAARRVGVSHNAGYRHFESREALLTAVADAGMGRLAVAMRAGLAEVGEPDASDDPVGTARLRLRAVGWAYVSFALGQPGLFRTAFSDLPPSHSAEPYDLLVDTVDDLVRVGALPPERRPHSEMVAWSAVHGLSVLLLEGPFRSLPAAEVAALFDRVANVIDAGL